MEMPSLKDLLKLIGVDEDEVTYVLQITTGSGDKSNLKVHSTPHNLPKIIAKLKGNKFVKKIKLLNSEPTNEGLAKNVSVRNSNNDQRAKEIGEPPYPKKVSKSGRHDNATDTAGVAGYDSNENVMKLSNLLKEIEFANQKQFDAYHKVHKLRPDTKVKIAGKVTTAGQAAKVKGTNVFAGNPKKDPLLKPQGAPKPSAHDFDTNRLGKLTKGRFEFEPEVDDEMGKNIIKVWNTNTNMVDYTVIPSGKGQYKVVSVNGPKMKPVVVSNQTELEKVISQLR